MKFSSKHPVLIYATAALLGYFAGSMKTFWLTIPLVPFLFLLQKQQLYCATVFFTLFLYSVICFPKLEIPPTGIHDQILFFPSSISKARSSFGSQWIYQAKATVNGCSVPCMLRLPHKKKMVHPPADCSYLIEGTIKPSKGFGYSFYPDKKKPWFSIKGSYRFAEWRYQSKQWVKNYVKKYYRSSQAAEFLGGILTGDLEDQMVKFFFGRAGLQHILAISGFHFSIMTAVLMFMLRLFLPPQFALHALLVLLFSYFVFLGCSASILRAWIMSLIAIIGILSRQTPIALNSLGLAILLILAIDPQMTFSIGFIFSFAVTASILLFYPICVQFLNKALPSRSLYNLKQLNLLDQHCYVIVTIAKNAIALSIAVNITAIPIALYFFGKFPLISLLYNLIIPLMVSGIMFLFIFGIFIPWLHPINQSLIEMTLDFVNHLPAPLNIYLRHSVNTPELFTWLTTATLLGILCWNKAEKRIEILY